MHLITDFNPGRALSTLMDRVLGWHGGAATRRQHPADTLYTLLLPIVDGALVHEALTRMFLCSTTPKGGAVVEGDGQIEPWMSLLAGG